MWEELSIIVALGASAMGSGSATSGFATAGDEADAFGGVRVSAGVERFAGVDARIAEAEAGAFGGAAVSTGVERFTGVDPDAEGFPGGAGWAGCGV